MKWGYGHADYWQERSLEKRERKFERNKNVSHGRRMGGPANGNATIKINMKTFMRRRMKHLSHILLPPAVNQHGLVKKHTKPPSNEIIIEIIV
jgi:hypothetical protein